MTLTFALPWCPATNNLYATVGRRRVPTTRYKNWMQTALACLPEGARFTTGVRITIVAYRPDRRKRDLDGLAKAPLDCLVKGGVIEDDSLVDALTLRWAAADPQKPGSVLVTVEAVQ